MFEQRPPPVYFIADRGHAGRPRRGRDGWRTGGDLALVKVPEHAAEELRPDGAHTLLRQLEAEFHLPTRSVILKPGKAGRLHLCIEPSVEEDVHGIVHTA